MWTFYLLRHKFALLFLRYFMAFGWYYPKVGKKHIYNLWPTQFARWCLDCIWRIKKLKNVGMANFNKTIGNENGGFVVFFKWLLMVHSHLMLSQCEIKKLGGILGDTQC